MKWIQATLTFTPDQVNCGRKGRLGVWRVRGCSQVSNPLITRIDTIGGVKLLRLMVARPYQRGVMVKPVNLALEFDAAVRNERTSIEESLHFAARETIYFGEEYRQCLKS